MAVFAKTLEALIHVLATNFFADTVSFHKAFD